MILSRKWLNQFIDLTAITNFDITAALNSLGFEVEKEQDFQQLNTKLLVGLVEESTKIPNTHLTFNRILIASNQTLGIVCGAPNIAKNQYVLVAPVGSTLVNGLTITPKTIQGYQSEGMICSLAEIGFSKNALTIREQDSIYNLQFNKLPSEEILGVNFNESVFQDFLWEVDLTLNRSDCLAALQLVKELANYFGVTPNLRTYAALKKSASAPHSVSQNLKIMVAENLAATINTIAYTKINLGSPVKNLDFETDLLLKKLKIPTTDSVVGDLANLTAWETGQPLTVLDAKKLPGNLKLEMRKLAEKELVVLTADNKIVQIIGEEPKSDYLPKTYSKELFVLALNFDNSLMRTQQKELNSTSIAIQRYMKPLNPNLYKLAFANFQWLLEQYATITDQSETFIVKKSLLPPTVRTISLQKVTRLLGFELTFSEITRLFTNLDIEVVLGNNELVFTIDPNRVDIMGENDLVEEIARLYGYDNIPEVPLTRTAHYSMGNWATKQENKLQKNLTGARFSNVKTYSLIPKAEATAWDLFSLQKPVSLKAPLSKMHETFRLSLASSLLEVAQTNFANGNKNLRLWEIANVYNLNENQRHLGLLICGTLISEPLTKTTLESNYFYLKGLVGAILRIYGLDQHVSFQLLRQPLSNCHPFVNAAIRVQNQVVGYLFRVNPKLESQKKLPPTYLVELNLDLIAKLAIKKIVYKPNSKYQASTRDLSILIPATMNYETLINDLAVGVDCLVALQLVDYYQDAPMKNQNESAITLSFVFNDSLKQMTDNDINYQWHKVLNNAKNLGITVR